jgi:formylglycine-generating enzyme required for sulfatase activity
MLCLCGGLAWALWPPSPSFAIGVEAPPEIRAGEAGELIVSIDRTRFPGPVRLRLDRLPPGLSAESDRLETKSRLATFPLRAALDAESDTRRAITIQAEANEIRRVIEVPIVVRPPEVSLPEGFERRAGSPLVEVAGLNCPGEIVRRFDDGTEVSFVLVARRRSPDPAPFYIMRDKVWNGLYRHFEEPPDPFVEVEGPGGIRMPGVPESGVDPEAVGRWPVLGVTAHRAHDFAHWLVSGGSPPRAGGGSTFSGRLPSASQWDRAAGFTDHPGDRLVSSGDEDRGIAINLDQPRPVGTSPGDVSPLGIRDMAGNGIEWTRDSLSRPGASLPLDGEAHDSMILRGHSYSDVEPFLPRHVEEAELGAWFADSASPEIGFRVVIEISP